MSRRRTELRHFVIRCAAISLCAASGYAVAHAQGISEGTVRPFVVGVIPVVGNGAVGGVAIAAKGAIEEAEQRDIAALREARREALTGVAGDITKTSELRKISLRRLDALLAEHASDNKPLPPEVLNLAGLQRIEYVFAYPDSHDIVL